MTKQLGSGYLQRLAAGVTTLAYCLRIERTDGVVYRFTSHSEPLTMDTGAVYAPDQGGADVTAVRHESGLQAATFDLEGALTANGIARADIAAGRFDYATVYLFRTDWEQPVEDEEPLGKGFWGQAELVDHRYTTEFRSLATLLEQRVGRVVTPLCSAELGDGRCRVRLEPPAWQATTAYAVRPAKDAAAGDVVKPTVQNGAHFQCVVAGTSGAAEPAWDTTIGNQTVDGTVTWEAIVALTLRGTVQSVTSTRELTVDLTAQPDDWWAAGKMTIVTGANAGIAREVETYSAGAFTLWQAFPFAIAPGETVEVHAGCRKRLAEDCVAKFDNGHNHQGFPFLPGMDAAHQIGTKR